MRTSALLRRRARKGTGWAPALAAAAVVHAAILRWVIAPMTSGMGGMTTADHAPPAPPEDALVGAAPLEPSCVGDALLAAGAGEVYCTTPFPDGTCRDEVAAQLAQDIGICHGESPPGERPVAVAFLDPSQLARIKAIDPEPLLDEIQPQAPPPTPEQQQQLAELQQEVARMAQRPQEDQVVETTKSNVDKAPDDARFLSEFNTKTNRETVARGSRQEPMVDAPKPEELDTKPNARDPSIAKPPPDRPEGADERAPDAPGKLSMRTPGSLAPSEVAQEQRTRGSMAGELAPTGDGASPHRGTGAISQEHRDPADMQHGQAGAGGGAPHVPNLRMSEDVLERMAGGGSVDHYEDVEEGDLTAVNSRQWVGASFMNRTKRLVAQEWRPADVWRRFDPTGSVYGFKTRVTVLRVTLAPDGTLLKTVVVHGSGVDFLDDEAIRAFKAAAPFPNPPPVLRGDDGNISFNFGFYFEIDAGHSNWKIFRAM